MPSSISAARAARYLVPILVCLLAAPALAMNPKDRRFVSAKLGIGVDAPPGWTFSTHTGYPSVVVLLLHPDGSRISIAASATPAKTARELVEINRRGLEAQKLTVVSVGAGARGGFEVVARAEARDEGLVQLYLVRPVGGAQQAIVISLIARSGSIATHRSALEWVVTRLALGPGEPSGPEKSPEPATDSKGAGAGSAGERPPEKERR
jgi:hypothetical protein